MTRSAFGAGGVSYQGKPLVPVAFFLAAVHPCEEGPTTLPAAKDPASCFQLRHSLLALHTSWLTCWENLPATPKPIHFAELYFFLN